MRRCQSLRTHCSSDSEVEKKKEAKASLSDGQARELRHWALWREMRQLFQILMESGPQGCLRQEVLSVQVCFSPLPLSLSPGTGECGMAQPVVIEHVSCRLLQSYCSSLFIKGGCSSMLRINFLFYGCWLVLWAGGGAGCWDGVWGVAQREPWAKGDWLCCDALWSSYLLFPLAGASGLLTTTLVSSS